jgi:hypothetical protein
MVSLPPVTRVFGLILILPPLVQEIVCNADHSRISWATTIHVQTGKAHYLPVKEDSGTEVNWIAPELVSRLAFEIHAAPQASIFRDFTGREYEATQCVTVPLRGLLRKSQHMECFVAPKGFPLDGVVVGSRFCREMGPAETMFAARPEDPAFLMMQVEKTVSHSWYRCHNIDSSSDLDTSGKRT